MSKQIPLGFITKPKTKPFKSKSAKAARSFFEDMPKKKTRLTEKIRREDCLSFEKL